jgi:hypothetical protein
MSVIDAADRDRRVAIGCFDSRSIRHRRPRARSGWGCACASRCSVCRAGRCSCAGRVHRWAVTSRSRSEDVDLVRRAKPGGSVPVAPPGGDVVSPVGPERLVQAHSPAFVADCALFRSVSPDRLMADRGLMKR